MAVIVIVFSGGNVHVDGQMGFTLVFEMVIVMGKVLVTFDVQVMVEVPAVIVLAQANGAERHFGHLPLTSARPQVQGETSIAFVMRRALFNERLREACRAQGGLD
jgi:hypothetical protein